jgi:diguanylate cyclase (GGDEF)-like protein
MASLERPISSRPSLPPDGLVIDVSSELDAETLRRRSAGINVILRLAMLAGLQMELDATLNILVDLVEEIVPYDGALIYFWEEHEDRVCVRLQRGMPAAFSDGYDNGNVLNVWARRFARPLVLDAGQNHQADVFLESVFSSSALVLPIVAKNRVMGSLQLFSRELGHFSAEDAQLLWIFSLIAENQLSRDYGNEGLLRFAFTDYLTGLKTRGYFEQQLDVEIKRAERNRTPVSLLMIDIDFFKQLNDTHGHHVGDQILREVASLLVKDMREIDTVARYGGEEFVLILPNTDRPGAERVAQRLRRNVEQAKFFAGGPIAIERLTISIGVAVFGRDAQFKRDLIEIADAALYQAKAQGRNQVVMFSASGGRPEEKIPPLS